METANIVCSVQVNGYDVHITRHPISDRKLVDMFTGQKIHHAFVMTESKPPYYTDKLTIDGLFDSDTEFHIKFDGSCAALIYCADTARHELFVRYDMKRDKKTNRFESKLRTDKWIECEPEPVSERATHWPFMRPANKATDKWACVAYDRALAGGHLNELDPAITYTVELMG